MATRPWREVSRLSPDEREAIRADVRREIALERTTLAGLRRARAMTQATVAANADMAQGDVSRLERRTDAYIGTVRRFIEALGGTMRILVEFPNAAPVEVEGFGESPVEDGTDRAPTASVKGVVSG